MEILSYDNLSSTSLQAAEFLRSGKEVPFAVIAGQQSGGRGRRGRSWSSPSGGIYLSLALPPPAVETALLGNLALWTGVQTARWLERKFNFRVGLKWPNDLVFDGRKLGGILVESGFEGGKQGPVIIGIGINCQKSPNMSGEAAPSSIALTEICKVTGNPDQLARELIDFIFDCWSSLNIANVGSEFMQWCPPVYRMWTGATALTVFQATGIESDGALRIKKLLPQSTSVILHSADHDYSVPLKTSPIPLLLADVGNSAIKIVRFDSPWSLLPKERHRFFHTEGNEGLRDVLALIGRQMPDRYWPIWLAGVAPEQIDQLTKLALEVGLTPMALEKRPVKCHGNNYPLNELGIDRLAAIEGWLTGVNGSEEVGVIASFGTALTVDVVRADGMHLGGVIAPGLALGGKSLNQHTGLLPLVQGTDLEHRSILGHSTRSAIASGLQGAAAGLVERICTDLIAGESVSREHLRIILTGGDWLLAAQLLPGAIVCEDLIFRGLQAMAGGGMIRNS